MGPVGVEEADVVVVRRWRVARQLGVWQPYRGSNKAVATPGADRREILTEVAAELPIEVAIRRETWFDRFRYAGPSASEHPGWSVGPPPSSSREVGG